MTERMEEGNHDVLPGKLHISSGLRGLYWPELMEG